MNLDELYRYGYYPGAYIYWRVTEYGDYYYYDENYYQYTNTVTSSVPSYLLMDIPWHNISAPTQSYFSSNQTQRITWNTDTSPNFLQNGGQNVITGYYLELSSNGGYYYTGFNIEGISTDYWEYPLPSDLFTYGTNYLVRVTPMNSCGIGRFRGALLSWTTLSLPPLTAPESLTNTVNNGSHVTFTWTALPNNANYTGGSPITSYLLQWSNLNGTTWWLDVVKSNILSYTQTNAGNDNFYNYRVIAVNARGQGVPSYNVSIVVPMAPKKLKFPTMSSINCTHVRFQWLAPNAYDAGRLPIIGYLAQYKLRSDLFYKAIPLTNYMNLYYEASYSALQMNSDTLYDFQFKPQNSYAVGSSWTDLIRILTPKQPAPMAAPQIPTTEITPTYIKITWNALLTVAETRNCTVHGYLLEYSQATGGTWIALTSSTYLNTNFIQTSGFNMNTNYNYRVSAYNAFGSSGPSTNTSVLTDNVPQAPAIPTCPAADINPTYIKVSWVELSTSTATGRDPVIYYKLEWYDSTSGASYVTLNPDVNIILTYNHTITYNEGIFPSGSIQYFRLYALNGCGYSAASTVLQCVADSVPNAVGTLIKGAVHPLNITVSWNDLPTSSNGGDPITFYRLEWYNPTCCWEELTNEDLGKILTFTHVVPEVFDQFQYSQYRVLSLNGVGWAKSYSPVLNVVTDKVPQLMNSLVVGTVNPTNISFSWSLLTTDAQTGGDTPYYYQVEWFDPSLNQFVALTTESQGILTKFTHNYGQIFSSGSIVRYRVVPFNGVGFCTNSTELQVTADKVPQAMSTVSVTSINPTNITFSWSAVTTDAMTGGDSIIYYKVEWLNPYQGNVYQVLTTESQGIILTYTHQNSLIYSSGSTQTFRVTAKNGVGFGASNTALCTADMVPQQMSAISFTVVNPTNITFTWTALTTVAQHGGDLPNYYHVEWLNPSTSSYEALTNSGQGIILSFLHSPGFIFASGSTQTYRVTAQNGVGLGASTVATCTADRAPLTMNTPTLVSVGPTQIAIKWTAISNSDPNNGGDPVVFYSVEWDQGTGNWQKLNQESDGMVTSFTHSKSTIFISNISYSYRIQAKNGVGYGAYSSALSIQADSVPTFMNPPSTTLANIKPTWIYLTWTGLTTDVQKGRDEPIYYGLEWNQGPLNTWVNLTTQSQGLLTSFNHTVQSPFWNNTALIYRTFAMNLVGSGAYSTEYSVTTDNTPIRLNTPVNGTVNYNSISLSWTAISADADTGYDPIIYYQVEFYDRPCYALDEYDCSLEAAGSGTWREISTQATQGTSTTFTHTIATHFHANENFRYRICGVNGVGKGACSSELLVLTDDYPAKMATPLNVTIVYNMIQVKFGVVTDLAAQGRGTIIKYTLQWDNYGDDPSNPWITLTTMDQDTGSSYLSYTHNQNPSFANNRIVKYRVRAENMVGVGQYSDPLVLLTDSVPFAMTSPIISATNITFDIIKTYWVSQSLSDNGRDPITYYSLEWDAGDATLQNTDAWTELTSTSGGIVYSYTLNCNSTNFPNNTDLRFRLRSKNGVGFGPYSPVTAVTTDRTPLKMNQLVLTSVNPKDISLQWTRLTEFEETGRDTILQYKLEYNNGGGTWIQVNTYTPQTSSTTHKLSSPFPSNQDQTDYLVSYRISALNGVGYGILSDELMVITDTYPRAMDIPVVADEITPHQIYITWTQLTTSDSDTGRDPIIYYHLYWKESGTTNYVELVKAPPSVSQYNITKIPKLNTQYYISVAAENGVGIGIYSSPIIVITDNVPTRMNTPVEDPATNATQIVVTWVSITDDSDTGRDPVLYYKLEWDNGASNWIQLTTPNISINTYTLTTKDDGIKNGTTYQFRVTPMNRAGFGAVSSTLSIIPSSPPNKMQQAVTAPQQFPRIDILVSVTEPQINGAAITSYDIKFKAKNGTYFTELTGCNGGSADFVSSRQCYVLHSVLRAAPFSLLKGDALQVIANAANLKGYNDSYSDPSSSSTAYVEGLPDAVGTPWRNAAQTTWNVVSVSFSALAANSLPAGGQTCSIISYHVQRNQGNSTGSDSWTDIKGLATNDTATTITNSTGIVGGTTYKFRVRALNKHGWGPYSANATVRAANVPSAPAPGSVTTSNSTLWVVIKWTAPFNNGLTITSYKIEIQRKSGAWSTSSECDGTTNATIVSGAQCQILMTTLRTASTYNYVYGDTPLFRVSAQNAEGWSPTTQSSGVATIQTEPVAPSVAMTNDASNTNDLQIKLQWTEITGIANWKGYIVHAYEIWWTDKDATFPYELLFNDTVPFQRTYTHRSKASNPSVGDTSYPTQPIIGGTRYKFKYRAVNIHGPGAYSVESLFYASTIPDQLSPIWTNLTNMTVTIAWNPTPNDHKQAVSAYRIKIRNKAGVFVEDTSICSGTKSAVVQALKCSALMSLFTNNLNLAIDDLIVVKVEAQNVMGYSIASVPNTDGITAKKLPQTAPYNLLRGEVTGKTQIQLNWTGITNNVDTGGQDVDYKVYYDRATAGTNWYVLTETTQNLTTYTEGTLFTMGKSYLFKVAAFNDFGIGPQSAQYVIWTAIPPTGLADPTTTLNLMTYVEEDDIILIDWVPPIDDGGLTVSYKIEVQHQNLTWVEVDQPNECSEKGTIINYFLPQATTLNAVTQCQILVSKLKFKWNLQINSTVLARITAYHVVGSVTSTLTGTGTARIPDPPCFRTTYPRILGGTNSITSVMAIDVDSLGNIAAGGYSMDKGLLNNLNTAVPIPIAYYIAKGNYYAWGKYIDTNDGTTTGNFQQVLDVAFRYDGQKIALSLDKQTYNQVYVIVVLNADGSLYGAFKDNSNQKGRVNITGTLFDNNNFITLAVDASQDGTDLKRYAQIVRFSVANPTAATITSALYIQGGSVNKVSSSLILQRIKSDSSSIYASAMIQDTTQNRRSILARITLSSGAVSKYFHYTTQSVGADYNTDQSIAVIKRMSLYEDDLTTLQIVSACILSFDGYRIHFGQFIFAATQLFTVLMPSTVNRWYCLGMFQRTANIAYTLYNDRSNDLPSAYTLHYGRIDYANKKIDSIAVVNHDGPNTYYGAYFVHHARFYYYGDTKKVVTTNTFNFAQSVGFINIYDQQETYSCTSASQSYSFSSPAVSITLDSVVTANMNWVTTGYTSGPNFAAQTGKAFRPLSLSGGLYVLNLKEPISNNTYCPVVTTATSATVQGPSIPRQMLFYDSDATSYPNQEVSFTPFQLNKFCPDQVNYYSTFIADNSQPLPSFITFDPANTKYIFGINNPSHVGTYNMILQATIGNNKTTEVVFTVQVASPCLGLTIIVPTLAQIPKFDISDLVPIYIDLDWQVQNPPTPTCGEIWFQFKLLNNTPGGVVDTNIFTIINTTTGLQKIKVWTQSIQAEKTWTDLKVEARLQGDLVQTFVYTIKIANKCKLTVINPVPLPSQVYYTGRDLIDYLFIWPETVGVCGPVTYSANEYLDSNPLSNNSLDAGVFFYPKPGGENNTLRIYTWDDSKAGSYKVRIWASLGVGGFQQSSTILEVQIIKDPCSYYPYVPPFVEDLTLWVNQTNQIVNIPPFTFNDTIWICNFTYELRTGTGTALDPIFVIKEIAKQGDGTNITLVTTDKTKVDMSPQVVRVRGWPKRQNTTYQQFTFRIFIAFLDKTDCSSGSYYNNATQTCNNCQSPCITCKTSATKCTWCIPGYVYVDTSNSCVQQTAFLECPTGTMRDPFMGFCRTCPDFCATCSAVDNCLTCVKNYFPAKGADGKYLCYAQKNCPDGYRQDDVGGCLPCSANCARCPTASVCNLCMDGYFLNTLTNQCTSNCPNGYYADAASKVCMVCSPACGTCVTNNYTCITCKDIGSVKHYKFGNTCVTRCPYLNYFQNEPARRCEACKPACKICINAIDDCIVCNPGSVISGRECLNSCPLGYYITVIGTCFQCDPACQKCTGSQNSMCQECVQGQFLTQTTCENKCNPPLFADNSTKLCLPCPYYCNQCTNANNCMKCKTGYKQEPQDCTGEMFLRVNSTMSLTIPVNTAMVPEDYNPTSATFEVWFKADNILSIYQEVILGLSPYKLRKKNGVAQIQLNYGDYTYCDSKNLKSGQWYHVAIAIEEGNAGGLYCYLDGELIQIGQTPANTINGDLQRFKEVSFGTSIDLKTSEAKFNGYLKEFRWWKKIRSMFQITMFKNVAITNLDDFNPPNQLLMYFKFDEKKNQNSFIDFSSKGSYSYDPTPTGFKLADMMEMREIYLKMCPEGTLIYFNDTLGYFNCTDCHPDCGNCNGLTNMNCTSCIAPYKLLETDQKCIINADCPQGYYIDSNKNCWPCHPYCTDCYGEDQYQCTACNQGFFKAYKRAGCIDSCPRGLYGNYITQSCSANPLITSLYPEDGSIFQYGTFIDLFATYQVLNEEPISTYSYGWILTKLSDSVDIAKDATKAYAGEDILRVHLDNNIIAPNFYYNITFYVKGNETVYNGMGGSMYNVIYIGIPPKGGECAITPASGVAGATEFTITTSSWKDPDGISEYRFLYSLNDESAYIPIPQNSYTESTLRYVFDPIFVTTNTYVKCQVKNLKGFVAERSTSFLLVKRSTANSKAELSKVNLTTVTTELQSIRVAKQLTNIAQDMGSLKKPPDYYFDPKISPDQCTDELCGFAGECKFQPFTKQYYCDCYGIRAGRNCTFKNQTELVLLKNMTLQNAKLYIQKSSGTYNREYLDMLTSNMDLMSDDLFDVSHDMLYKRILDFQTAAKISDDITVASEAMKTIANLMEYLDYDGLTNIVTGSWNASNNSAAYQGKLNRNWDNQNRTLRMVKMVQNTTLYQLSFLQTEIQMTSRKLSYKQVLTSRDKILSIPATENIKKQQSTFAKISPANFENTSIALNDDFIAEATEYTFNPFQMNSNDKIATNIFEINLYNQNKTVTTNEVTKVEVKDLKVPIEFSFPASDNQNLTEFLRDYNALNPFRNVEKLKKEQMVNKSGLSCVYWEPTNQSWSKHGCILSNIDSTHIKCSCTHLSAFAIFFETPKLTVDAPLLENSTTNAGSTSKKTLTLEDIIRWPLDKYFENLQELWQHNQPSFLGFVLKPGFIVLGLFWAMYLSSLVYYSGRDDIRRYNMTKSQNRNDLAELKDDQAQNLSKVIRDLIVRDFLDENGKYIAKEARRLKAPQLSKKQIQPPQIKIYEQMSKDEKRKYKKRARRKVFGVPAGLCERAERFYNHHMKLAKTNPNAKTAFFNEELKNNYWIGLIAKTSKIAPRHVRLAMMYLYASLYIIFLTMIFAFQLQEYISEQALFQVVALSLALIIAVWIITIPVALIFRMPMDLRQIIAGVRTKKVNKAFKELDKRMGCRYAVGYFICLFFYAVMTVMVLVFNAFYPQDYVIGWAFNVVLIYIFDLVLFTFGLAAFQMAMAIASGKVKCFYKIWKAIEVFRYIKNLRG